MTEIKMDEVILCDICEVVCSDDFWVVGLDNGFTAEFCPRCYRKSILDRLNDEVE